tara:strand:+ start:120 stop:485 length:366 start_codon:yes stop_codon:yes gene_type:complete
MFGTCIGVFDGYARAANECIKLLFTKKVKLKSTYKTIIWFLSIGSVVIIKLFGNHLTELVDMATTISFMIAPFVALANYKLVLSPYLKGSDIPPAWLKYLAIIGIAYLFGFGFLFIHSKII